jgi:hypothetical protein
LNAPPKSNVIDTQYRSTVARTRPVAKRRPHEQRDGGDYYVVDHFRNAVTDHHIEDLWQYLAELDIASLNVEGCDASTSSVRTMLPLRRPFIGWAIP